MAQKTKLLKLDFLVQVLRSKQTVCFQSTLTWQISYYRECDKDNAKDQSTADFFFHEHLHTHTKAS